MKRRRMPNVERIHARVDRAHKRATRWVVSHFKLQMHHGQIIDLGEKATVMTEAGFKHALMVAYKAGWNREKGFKRRIK